MADSLLPEVLPAHSAAGELSTHTSEKPASLLKTSNTEELSEAADTGSSRSYQNQLPIDTYCRSQQSEQNLRFTSEDGCSLYNEESTRTALEESVAVVHPEIETECGEEGDVCEGCGRSKSEGRKMLQLEKDVQRLEEALKEREQTIASLLEENIQKTAELLEIQLQKVLTRVTKQVLQQVTTINVTYLIVFCTISSCIATALDFRKRLGHCHARNETIFRRDVPGGIGKVERREREADSAVKE